jgi:hypothetical protein
VLKAQVCGRADKFSTVDSAVLEKAMQLYTTKQPNLKLKTRPKQLSGSLALPGFMIARVSTPSSPVREREGRIFLKE